MSYGQEKIKPYNDNQEKGAEITINHKTAQKIVKETYDIQKN